MIHRDDRASVAVLRLEHGKANALDVELVAALTDHLHDVERSNRHKAAVLTGTGSIFCAGVDLFRFEESGAAYLDTFFHALVDCFLQVFTFPRPLIAAVNGHAIAGGCVLAAAADYRVMRRGSGTIGVPELRVGIPFPVAAIEILRFAASTQQLQELVYLGRTYDPEQAHARGLVDELVDSESLLERALDVAGDLGSMPAARFGITKRQLRAPGVDRIERLAPTIDAEVLRGWKDPSTHAAIRSYLRETLGKRA